LEIEPGNESALAALEAARQSVLKYGLAEAKAAAVTGNNAAAIRILDDLLSISPASIEALTMKSHLAEGFDEKIRCFENILAIDPENVAAKSGRDSLLEIFGTMEAAEAENSRAPQTGYSNGETDTAEVDAVLEPFEPTSDKSPTQDLELPATMAENTHLFDASIASPVNENYTEVENDNDTVQAVAEPFATYAEEVSESPSYDFDAVKVDEGAHELFAIEDAQVSSELEDPCSDPHAETVAFSYEEIPGIVTPDEDGGPSSLSGEYVIPMPESELPEPPVESSAVTLVVKPDSVDCVYCGNANEPQSISCHACMAVLTLSDLELLLANQNADKVILREAVEQMERKRSSSGDLTVEELTVLGLGHLNLRNLQLGYAALSEASRLDPNNVVLSSQVNSLLIRLEEIRLQEEAHLKMPKGKSILVVDDSATVRKLIAGKLEKSGHDVVCANDGVEAMERLDDFIPDLILLDITMPRMDGYQVCKNIRSKASTKDVPVVMISGKDGFFDKVRGRMAGTTGYITKPFGPETLMKAVEMYLSGDAPDLDEV
jgi:CheY-like chemotaxis protein